MQRAAWTGSGVDIQAIDPALLPSLTRLINAHIASAVPRLVLTEQLVNTIIEDAALLWSEHYPEQLDRATSADYAPEVGTLCVAESGSCLAAAQWLRLHSHDPYVGESFRHDLLVQWIVAEPGRFRALANLLRKLESVAANLGCTGIRVDARFSFGSGWLGVADDWDHLVDGLLRNGYLLQDRWSIFERTVLPLPASCPPEGEVGIEGVANTALAWRVDEEAGEWICIVRIGETDLGECQAWDVPRHLRSCAGAERWITIEWIDVDEGYQRRGLGRYLMGSQLAFQAERGKSSVVLWCDAEDSQACAFYRGLGFREAFRSLCFVKALA